jgi:low temperature requirement protein LtrA
VVKWRIYFAIGFERGSRLISRSHDPGRLARSAYAHVHAPIVAGVVVTAVADKLVLTRTIGAADTAAAVILGGSSGVLLGPRCRKNLLGNRRNALERVLLAHDCRHADRFGPLEKIIRRVA